MADADNPENNIPEEIPGVPNTEGAAASLANATEEFNRATENLLGSLDGIEQSSGGLDAGIKRSLQSSTQSVNELSATSTRAGKIIRDNLFGGFSENSDFISNIMSDVGRDISNMAKSSGDSTRELARFFQGGLGIAVAGFGKKAADSFNQLTSALTGGEKGLLDIEQELMNTEKASLRAGMAFGRTFDEAEQSTEMYRRTLSDTIKTTRTSADDVATVREALSKAFDTSEMTRNLGNLTGALGDVESAANLTNVAILAAEATGMDAAKMAEMLGTAHLELGESVESAGEAMANIADAAADSGLTFADVSSAITEAASALKMWGGTIGSVTPIFKSFVNTLGEGRKGLATDLMKEYVGGLESMGLSMRSLIGTVGGMGGAGGAIGAGLEMEAALEGGEEGMQTVTENLTQALKQFGGGEIITREQAIASPELQQNFILQRQLLQQMGVAQDDASATKMIELLKGVEEGGMETGTDTIEKLSETIRSGEDARKSTQSTIQETSQRVESAVQGSGDKVVASIRALADSMGLTQFITRLDNNFQQLAREGKIDVKELSSVFKQDGPRIRAGAQAVRQRRAGGQDRRVPRGMGRMQRAARGAPEDVQEMMRTAQQSIMGSMSELAYKSKVTGRAPPPRAAALAVTRALQPLRDELNRLSRKSTRSGEFTEEDQRKKIALQKVIQTTEEGALGKSINEFLASELSPNRGRRRGRNRSRGGARREGPPPDFRDPASLTQAFGWQGELPEQARGRQNQARGVVAATGGRRRQAPVRETADRAAGIRRRQEEVKFKFTSEPVEQEVKLRLISDKESVSIKVDDEHIKKIVREVNAKGYDD